MTIYQAGCLALAFYPIKHKVPGAVVGLSLVKRINTSM
jgi:hypothetical protein